MEPQARGNDLPMLEVKCDVCDGRGWRHSYDGERRCGVCDGAGYVPTGLGEQILALMRHNFRPMLEDATGD